MVYKKGIYIQFDKLESFRVIDSLIITLQFLEKIIQYLKFKNIYNFLIFKFMTLYQRTFFVAHKISYKFYFNFFFVTSKLEEL